MKFLLTFLYYHWAEVTLIYVIVVSEIKVMIICILWLCLLLTLFKNFFVVVVKNGLKIKIITVTEC